MGTSDRVTWLASRVIVLVILIGLLAQAIPAAAADLAVSKQTESITFPTKLEFDLIADAPRPVKSVEVWYRPVYSPVTLVSRPNFTGGSHIDVASTVDTQINYLWPGIDIFYHWHVTLDDGSILETPEKTFLYMDTRTQWSTATSGPVTVYYQKGDDQLGQEALNTTVKSIEQFQQTFHITSNEPIHIVVYGSTSAFSSALPPNSAEWIGGVAEPELHLVITGIAPGFNAESEVQRVLSHEVVHLVVGQATNNPFNTPPPWLDEGLATYYQEVQDSRFPPALQNAVESGQLIPIRALNSSFPDDPNQALLSYAESESVVTFILKQKGADKMAALLQAFNGGVSNEQAVQAGLGISIDQLDQEWKAWLGYQGDRGTTASTDANPSGPDIGQGFSDLMSTSTSVILIGVAALFCVAAGTILMLKSRGSRDESP